MLHLGRLKVLSEVVSKGSFSAAAESLSYTQSAVSQAIARLESETGATTAERAGRPTLRPCTDDYNFPLDVDELPGAS